MNKLACLALIAPFALAAPAFAQGGPPTGVAGPAGAGGPPARPEGWSVTVGVAPILSPAWQGSDEMSLSVFPDIRLDNGDGLTASVPEGIVWSALDADGWRAGPVVRYRFGRDEDDGGSPFLITGGSDALLGLGDIDGSIEAGGFVEKRFGARGEWEVGARVLRGFGGHEGVVADLSLDRRFRSGRTMAAFGPRLTLASKGYMQPYFGIDAVQSANRGLAEYDAGGGVLSWGAGGSVVHPFDRNTAVTLFTSLERLGKEATDSPLVRERGQRTQFTLGLGFGYRFGL